MRSADYSEPEGQTAGVGMMISRMVDGKPQLLLDRKPEQRIDMIKEHDIKALREKLAKAKAAYAKAMEKAHATARRNKSKLVITIGIRSTAEMIKLYERTLARWEGR